MCYSQHGHVDAKQQSPVAQQFNEHKHVSHLRLMSIQVVNVPKHGGIRDRLLLQREALWIDFLHAHTPNGLNEDFSLTCYLQISTAGLRYCIAIKCFS